MIRALLAVAVVIAYAVPAAACPFCTAVEPSLCERRDTADLAALVEALPSADDARSLAIRKLLRGSEPAEGTQLAIDKADIATGSEIRAGQLGLLLRDRRDAAARETWQIVPLDEVGYAYVAQAPARRLPPAERLAYFVKFLEHPNPLIAEDAYREFGAAPFDAVKEMREGLPQPKLRAWIVDPRVPESHKGFYGLALGLAVDPADKQANERVLRQLITAPADDFRGGFDGVLGGYLLLGRADALAFLDRRLLSTPDAPLGDVRHAMTALRFMHEFGGDAIPAADISRALRHTLNRPELAAAAIIDLARWEDWDALGDIVPLFDRAGYADRPTTRAIVGYLAACPRAEAAAALARFRQAAPSRVAEAEGDALLLPNE